MAALVVSLATAVSACGDSASHSAQLPKALHAKIDSWIAKPPGWFTGGYLPGQLVNKVDVYGSATFAATFKALDPGDWKLNRGHYTQRERHAVFYLLVLRGKFINDGPKPPSASPAPNPAFKAPIQVRLWSAKGGDQGYSLFERQPAGVAGLHLLKVVKR